MKFRNGIDLFTRTNDTKTFNLASFHSPHSMTWRWILSFIRQHDARFWPLWWSYNSNTGRQIGLRVPFIGHFSFQTQQPMYYRDLYYRERDRADTEKSHLRHQNYKAQEIIEEMVKSREATRQ